MNRAHHVGELSVVPDYEDFVYVGREITIRWREGADVPGLVWELGDVAERLRSREGLQAYEVVSANASGTTFRATHCDFTVQVDVGAELGVLLLRFAKNHLKRCGVLSDKEWLVMTDPYDVEMT